MENEHVANNNIKLGIGLAVVLVALFTSVIVKYSMKQDPTMVSRSEKSGMRAADARVVDSSSESEALLATDDDLLTTLGGDASEAPEIDENAPVVTQSTEKLDNRRKTETTTAVTTTASSKADTAENKKQKAQEALASAEAKLNETSARLDGAQAALDEAKGNRDRLQSEFEAAKARLEEVKRGYDANQNENYKRGLYGFYESIGNGDGMNAFNASEYSSAVETGNAKDAASIENVKRSIDFLNKANQLRAAEGRSELRVSYRLMALAVLNNDVASNNGQSANNTGLEEDLAFGYEDPFDAWYNEQKENGGDDFNRLMKDDAVAMGFAFSNKNNNVHNILFATEEQGPGETVSVSEFADKFNEYYNNTIKGKSITAEEEAYKNAENALNGAKQTVSDKENELKTASAAYGSAKTVYDERLKALQAFN